MTGYCEATVCASACVGRAAVARTWRFRSASARAAARGALAARNTTSPLLPLGGIRSRIPAFWSSRKSSRGQFEFTACGLLASPWRSRPPRSARRRRRWRSSRRCSSRAPGETRPAAPPARCSTPRSARQTCSRHPEVRCALFRRALPSHSSPHTPGRPSHTRGARRPPGGTPPARYPRPADPPTNIALLADPPSPPRPAASVRSAPRPDRRERAERGGPMGALVGQVVGGLAARPGGAGHLPAAAAMEARPLR